MSESITHHEFQEQVEAYLAGGLEGTELEAFLAHRDECATCNAILEDAMTADAAVSNLFHDARPTAGLEDRILQRLRWTNQRRRIFLHIHPAVRKAAGGLAAALVLGAMGYVGSNLIEEGRLPWGGSKNPAPLATNLSGAPVNGAVRMLKGELTPLDSLGGDLASPAKEAEKLNKDVGALVSGFQRKSQVARERGRAGMPGTDSYFGWMDGGAARGDATRGYVSDQWAATNAPAGTPLPALTTTDPQSATVLSDDADRKVQATGRLMGKEPMLRQEAVRELSEAKPGAMPPSEQPVTGLSLGLSTSGGVSAANGTWSMSMTQPQVVNRYFQPAADSNGDGGDVKYSPLSTLDSSALGRSPEGSKELRDVKLDVKEETLSKSLSGKTLTVPQAARRPVEVLAAAVAEPTVTEPPSPPPQTTTQSAASSRKIIRNGEIEFEVDGFDSSVTQVTKIVIEENGFVSSTNSEKLPNGKVRGTIVVRVPPERLDTFVLKLRALGDLRSQKISAQDVTKQYYDLESELKAGRAMEERLLNIIKSGNGAIKDLLEAEKQLGVYRTKIEKLEGEIRYYNNLVSLSTLSITLTEHDIRTPAVAAQTELVSMGIETDTVEKARTDAIKAIEEAKGRIIESNLKQHDAGQLAATIVCDIPPDAGGPLIDRLRQLGRVARLDIDRKQTNRDGNAAPQGSATNAPTRIERKDTRFSLSIYNLANIAPRQTTNLNVAVPDVEEAYRSIMASVNDRGGRVVTSSLNRQKPEQTTGSINFELPSGDAEAALTEIRRDREVMGLTVTENPDTQNVTAAKRGFNVQIYSLAVVAPRETEQLVLTARTNVAETFRTLLDVLRKADARILVSQLNEQEGADVAGTLEFEVLRTRELDVRTAMAGTTDALSRSVSRSSDTANTVDSKLRLNVRLMSLDKVPARETQSLAVAVGDVPSAFQTVVSLLTESSARVITSRLNQDDQRNVTGVLDFEIARDRRDRIEKALASAGAVYARSVTRATDTSNSVDSKVRLMVTLNNASQLPARERTRLMLEVSDVEARAAELTAASDSSGGRTLEQTQSRATDGTMSSHIVIDVPLEKAPELRRKVRDMGTVRVVESASNPQAPSGAVARAGQLDITLASPDLLVGRDNGLSSSLRSAISTSVKGLLWSLQFIVVGLLFVGPWALLVWFGVRMIRRNKPATAPLTPA